jgi:uncharacterized membrane protein
MSLKAWSLVTCLAGWLTLALSLVLTRFFETDGWQVVIPLTVHLFAYMVLAAAAVLTLLWALWMSRWQEDMAVALINLLLCATPVLVVLWNYWHQHKTLTKFVLALMWTGK